MTRRPPRTARSTRTRRGAAAARATGGAISEPIVPVARLGFSCFRLIALGREGPLAPFRVHHSRSTMSIFEAREAREVAAYVVR